MIRLCVPYFATIAFRSPIRYVKNSISKPHIKYHLLSVEERAHGTYRVASHARQTRINCGILEHISG